ncbi:polyketide cyclase / dehydrase and lipidtransport protein [Striga asiatica]|uniref:Polyketide cyclase / dehydrase and lipidtransport protein n=1 Tax=Striga asiatica TaxID=4170 RepID=A0A5A7QYD5_STRAF|nr:polyketide cyclase / dehydrase and lipidtransport protein [Striga asiatica]
MRKIVANNITSFVERVAVFRRVRLPANRDLLASSSLLFEHLVDDVEEIAWFVSNGNFRRLQRGATQLNFWQMKAAAAYELTVEGGPVAPLRRQEARVCCAVAANSMSDGGAPVGRFYGGRWRS